MRRWTTSDQDPIEADLSALAVVGERKAGSEGERRMAHAVKERLPDGVKARVEGFVAFTNRELVLGAHATGLLVSGLLGLSKPMWGALFCALFTLSLWAENTGRFSLFRRFAPKLPSYNLVVPGDRATALGTLVISAPLDAPKWRPETPDWLKRPLKATVAAAIAVTSLLTLSALAQPWGRPTQGMYLTSLLVLVGTVVLGIMIRRRTTGLDEDVSGPAVLLELQRRFMVRPVEHTDVWIVFTGCGHAYQNGMAAFLAMNGDRLREPVLVVALDDPGRAPLRAVVSEGTLLSRAHRPTGPALVERLRWCGEDIPSIDLPGETDARAAQFGGLRGLAFAGDPDSPPDAASARRATDVIERLARLYDEDLARVRP